MTWVDNILHLLGNWSEALQHTQPLSQRQYSVGQNYQQTEPEWRGDQSEGMRITAACAKCAWRSNLSAQVGDASTIKSESVRDLMIVSHQFEPAVYVRFSSVPWPIRSWGDMQYTTAHISSVIESVTASWGLLESFAFSSPNQQLTNNMAVSFVIPRFRYCSSALWKPAAIQLNKRRVIQNAAANVVARSGPLSTLYVYWSVCAGSPSADVLITRSSHQPTSDCMPRTASSICEMRLQICLLVLCCILRSQGLAFPVWWRYQQRKHWGRILGEKREKKNAAPELWNNPPDSSFEFSRKHRELWSPAENPFLSRFRFFSALSKRSVFAKWHELFFPSQSRVTAALCA